MTDRRRFVLRAAALAAASTLAPACSKEPGRAYADAVRAAWRHSAEPLGSEQALLHEVVRYATLAASSHNTQPWIFRISSREIAIRPDFSRRCRVVDPDDHHLYASLGCAAENLRLAGRAFGLDGEPVFDPERDEVRYAFAPAPVARPTLFDAIPLRQCTRSDYDGSPVSAEQRRALSDAGRGTGVEVRVLTARNQIENVLEYVARGNRAQTGDPAFVAELEEWIRFSESEALLTRDGLFTGASGNPVVPRWLGSRLFRRFFTAERENERAASQLRSSAGVAVFVSAVNDRAHWVEVGRCCQRLSLQATVLGLRVAFVNQPVEVSGLREEFAAYLGVGERRPDLVLRFGRGPEMPRSLRRPTASVIGA